MNYWNIHIKYKNQISFFLNGDAYLFCWEYITTNEFGMGQKRRILLFIIIILSIRMDSNTSNHHHDLALTVNYHLLWIFPPQMQLLGENVDTALQVFQSVMPKRMARWCTTEHNGILFLILTKLTFCVHTEMGQIVSKSKYM